MKVEINRLKRISERQSEQLALALKEKNDLLAGRGTFTDRQVESLKDQLERTQKDLAKAHENLRDLKTAATGFARAMGWL